MDSAPANPLDDDVERNDDERDDERDDHTRKPSTRRKKKKTPQALPARKLGRKRNG